MFGVIPCTAEEAAEDFAKRPLRALVGATRSRLSSLSLSQFLDDVVDQFATNSCVANAGSSACVVNNAAKGTPIKRPSRRHLYNLARYMRDPGKPLVDLGSSARLMCEGASRHGLVAEERWPFDPDRINEPHPFDVDIAGADALFLDYWRASDDPDELRVALEQKEIPTIAIPVHQNFIDCNGDGSYRELAGDFRGYHMLAVVGFDGDDFEILNSWGRSWGSGGFCRMAASFIQQHAFDRYVIRSAPAPR